MCRAGPFTPTTGEAPIDHDEGGAKDTAGNIVGINPHKKTLSGRYRRAWRRVDIAHFKVSGGGHRALEA